MKSVMKGVISYPLMGLTEINVMSHMFNIDYSLLSQNFLSLSYSQIFLLLFNLSDFLSLFASFNPIQFWIVHELSDSALINQITCTSHAFNFIQSKHLNTERQIWSNICIGSVVRYNKKKVWQTFPFTYFML